MLQEGFLALQHTTIASAVFMSFSNLILSLYISEKSFLIFILCGSVAHLASRRKQPDLPLSFLFPSEVPETFFNLKVSCGSYLRYGGLINL